MVLTQSHLIMLHGTKCHSGGGGGGGGGGRQPYHALMDHDSLYCCLICVDNTNSPKLLDCQHVFCETCLQMYYKECHNIQYEQQGIFIPCPTCRKLTKVPHNGLCGLEEDRVRHSERLRKISQSSNQMQRCDVCSLNAKDVGHNPEARYYCSKCLMNFCDACHAIHSQQPLFKSHPIIHISNKETICLSCDRHNNLPIKYFCLDCNLPACTVCILREHNGHHAAELRDALAMRRDNLRTLLNSLGPKLDKMDARVKKLTYITMSHSKCKNHTSDQQLRVSGSDAESTISENGSLHRDLTSLIVKRATSGNPSVQRFTLSLERLRRLYDLSTKILDMSQSKKLLVIYEDIVGRIQSVLDIEMQSLHDDIETCLEKESVTSELGGHSTPPSSANSTHSLQNQSLSSEDIKASTDFLFEAHQSLLIKPKLLWKVEKQRSDVGELYNPCDVDFFPDGSLIVAEYDMVNDKNNRIRICDQQGGTRDILAQGKIRPLGIGVTLDGNIVLTDCKDKRLKLYTPSGQLMAEVGKGQFGWPYGIAVNSKGQIIVSDAFNDNISIFHQSDGKRIRHFGSSGSNSVQFKNPYHVAVDSRDNILVSDSGNNCVKVFDASGRFMFKTAEIKKKPSLEHGEVRKSRKKKLKAPRGICIDLKGNILVADDYSRVCMFDESGHFIRNLLTDEDAVKYPEAIACGNRGQIAVTEWNPNNMFSIKMFNMYE